MAPSSDPPFGSSSIRWILVRILQVQKARGTTAKAKYTRMQSRKVTSCLMDCTVTEATKKVENKYQIQSPYINPKAGFEKWDWVAAETKTVDQTFLSQDGLKELLSVLHLSTTARNWDLETVQHIRAWKADGKEGPVSLQLHHISILSLTASTGLDRT